MLLEVLKLHACFKVYGYGKRGQNIITARKRSCGKVMFLQLSVILFTRGKGVCFSACWDTPPPLRADTPPPPRSRHPPAQCMLGDTVNKRAVCILLECNLVEFYAT